MISTTICVVFACIINFFEKKTPEPNFIKSKYLIAMVINAIY